MKSPYEGAGFAIFRKSINGYEILLGQRTARIGHKKWSIIGGSKEKQDNSFLACAKRELYEELLHQEINGIIVGNKKFTFPFFRWQTFFMLQTEPIQIAKHNREFYKLMWIPISNLKRYPLCFGVKIEVKSFLKVINPNG